MEQLYSSTRKHIYGYEYSRRPELMMYPSNEHYPASRLHAQAILLLLSGHGVLQYIHQAA